jgi:hypothetical protein
MPTIAASILSLITQAPAAINAISSVYQVIRADLSLTDQDAIDKALAAAIAGDAAATKAADKALDEASRR